MNARIPRVLIAGTSSGSGKTTAVCALLTLLKRRGVRVSSCKCGPDYIDPMFHESVLGIPASNLDPFFADGDLMRSLLAENAGDVTVIEGVMGYYDGTGADGTQNSTYSVAAAADCPVVLVVNAGGASTSALAVLEGFLRFVPDSRIAGVLYNNVTPMTFLTLKKLTEARFGNAVTVAGYIPKLPEDCVLGSRHLGLVTAQEITGLRAKLDRIADLCAETVDLDALLTIAGSAREISFEPHTVPSFPTVRIAVARDAAFCFYYADTLRLLEKMGAVLLPFSPLRNEPVPPETEGLLLGGGYPELYAETLEANVIAKNSVAAAVRSGMPTIAECGGFQYLGRMLEGRKMCGVLPHDSDNTGKLVRFGYITLTAQKDGLLGARGTTLRAHEFHYYDSTDNGSAFRAEKTSGKAWDCAVTTDSLYAGYPHLYLPASLPSAVSFYEKCLAYRRKGERS